MIENKNDTGFKLGQINAEASKLFNSLSDEDRKNKAGLGYTLAQHTTIIQMREMNKKAWEANDRKLYDWQKNVERALKEYLR